MKFIDRKTDWAKLNKLMSVFPVTAILGPRQCGKTKLAQLLAADFYFDLENPQDLARLEHPQLAMEDLTGLIVIDEIQRLPDLFPLLRYLVDQGKKRKFVILGSASRDLIRQSSESLAGRIAYLQLGGFRLSDIGAGDIKTLWWRGGLPPSFLAASDDESLLWRNQYVMTFLERDIPQLGITIPARTLRRFWTMLSHYHGHILNYAELGRSFGISDMTVRKYCDILEGTFMVRILQPWYVNIGKRLVKRPKLYLRDSGLFHALQFIENPEQLYSSPRLGASWEGFSLECVCRTLGKEDGDLYFWNTHAGAELDLFWQARGQNWGVEFKYEDAPRLTRSMKTALEDLELERLWVVYPGKAAYRLTENIRVLPLADVPDTWNYG
ncbi:MAG: ATP-binding protein [Candidatus Altiarchaeota archaeon]|nr:ATP-binding protein [Candidatus Altiarchaeota archaeon]